MKMNPLIFFIFITTVAALCYFLGHSVGYVNGRTALNKKIRVSLPEDDELLGSELQHIEAWKNRGEDS